MYPELRLAGGEHVPALTELDGRIFPEDPWPSSAFEQRTPPDKNWRTILAILDGEIIGYGCCSVLDELLHIENLAVVLEHRRQRIGSILLDEMESWGSRRGCRISVLEVRADDHRARRFYDRRGYRLSGMLESYYRSANAARMSRPLSASAAQSRFAELAQALEDTPAAGLSVGVVLGSGLSWLVEETDAVELLSYEDLPGLESEGLPGHPGRLAVDGRRSMVFLMGRRHRYQGFDAQEIALLPGALSDLGTANWLLTSSAGAVDPLLTVGEAMLFSDHVNLTGMVPDGTNACSGSDVYSSRLRTLALQRAEALSAPVSEGVFACSSGPAYETPAESELLGRMGVSAVSMSTVPEALWLSQRGCEVMAMAMITNSAASTAVVTHQEVLAAQDTVRRRQSEFLVDVLGTLAGRDEQ